jgi:hypothetical protein
MVQRLDRLTQDEARLAIAQILDVVHGLVKSSKIVMEGEQNALGSSLAGHSGGLVVDSNASVDYLQDTLGMFFRRQSNDSISD